eukprot:568617-Lingulodinium_polyedra.AAC.1
MRGVAFWDFRAQWSPMGVFPHDGLRNLLSTAPETCLSKLVEPRGYSAMLRCPLRWASGC